MSKIAWGYIFLHFSINLETIDILPDWAGYLMILSALPEIGKYQPSALLLRPLAILLAAWAGVLWAATLIGGSFDIYIVSLISSVVRIYFHFQLLTNLSEVSRSLELGLEKRLLSLRTLYTIMSTVFALLPFIQALQAVYFLILAVYMGTAVVICITLFRMKNLAFDHL